MAKKNDKASGKKKETELIVEETKAMDTVEEQELLSESANDHHDEDISNDDFEGELDFENGDQELDNAGTHSNNDDSVALSDTTSIPDVGGSNFEDSEPDPDEDDPDITEDEYEEHVRNLNIGPVNAINDLSREMISRMNELRNKYLDFFELMRLQEEDEDARNDHIDMIMDLDMIDVHSCLERADRIVKLLETIVDHTLPY